MIRTPEMNLVIVSGRLTKDPEFFTTQSARGVLAFDIAVNRRYLDRVANEWKDDTVFVPVVVWGDAAARLKERAHKGTPVMVEGRLTTSQYTNKDGRSIKKLQITAARVQVLESTTQYEPKTGDDVPETPEEDIPF